MNKMENKSINYACLILSQLVEMIKNEDCENYIDIEDENLTEFFTALVMASCQLMNGITGENKNYLQHTYILNNLIVQYLIDHGALDKNKESKQG